MSFAIDKRRLPPLNALIAFEAAARLGSFALAGAEIHLSPSAISRQVKALEEHLGIPLFERIKQRIVLTEAGRFLAVQVRETLGRLLTVSDQAAQFSDVSRTLNLGVLAAFANFWLIPHLPAFVKQHPDIDLNIISIGVGYDYDNGELDAAIHTNARIWSDTGALRLGDEDMIVVASPDWIAEHQPLTMAELPGSPLIGLASRPYLWTQWFEHNGVAMPPRTRSMTFAQYSMVFEAAICSLGVALVPRMLAQDKIARGQLAEIPGKSLPIGAGYYLVQPLHRENYEPLQQFRAWLAEYISS